MRRREFLGVLVGAAAWPIAARAQQPTPVVGFLSARSPGESAHLVAAFRQGLRETGHLEGQNVHISFRWAEGRYDRLADLAAELVHARVGVITSVGGAPAALAAKTATSTIPIVAVTSDPVKHGLVASFNRPGGNITAISPSNTVLSAKRLGLLRELVPRGTPIGLLVNPKFPDGLLQLKDTEEAARTLGQTIHVVNASSEGDIEAAFAKLVQQRVGALLASADPFFDTRRDQIVALAARHAVPTIYAQRAYAVAGGLMSYASSFAEAYRQAGIYAGRILKGETPADLPVVQPTRFELVINLKAERDIEVAFTTLLQLRAGALMIGTDPFFNSRSDQLAALALRHAVPTIYQFREFAAAGGLMSYGTSITDQYRRVGLYTGRILKGEKPADLPVQQSTEVELIINLKTAKALGLAVPQSLLGRADEGAVS